MATQRLQTSRAISVVPDDTIEIPKPSSEAARGTQTSATANKLTDSSATFDDGTISIGNIVHDTTGGSIATVTAIDSATVLSISADIFTGTEDYVIYREGAGKGGCVIYVGGLGDVSITTSGGDTELLSAVPAGTILPINIKRVNSTDTSATLIKALF